MIEPIASGQETFRIPQTKKQCSGISDWLGHCGTQTGAVLPSGGGALLLTNRGVQGSQHVLFVVNVSDRM